jgi:hypothetical protein
MVVDYKKGLARDEVEYNLDDDSTASEKEEKKEEKELQNTIQTALSEQVESLKKHHTMEEVNAILTTIRRERDEVMDIWNRDGGDLDEIIARVRAKTRAIQVELMKGLSENERKEVEDVVGKIEVTSKSPTIQEAVFEDKSK